MNDAGKPAGAPKSDHLAINIRVRARDDDGIHQHTGVGDHFAARTRKMRSTLDVALPDGMGDDEYAATLARHLGGIWACFEPELVFYLAGVDAAQGDRYGRLALSDEGIRRREREVLEACRARGLPTVITIAGGYAATPQRTAELHAIAFREAVTHVNR